jgi:hypothetical protein
MTAPAGVNPAARKEAPMRRLLSHVRRHHRRLLLALFAAAMFLLWFGVWITVLPIRPFVVIRIDGVAEQIQLDAHGETLATVNDRRVVQFWNTRRGVECAPRIDLPGRVEPGAFLSPDGNRFVCRGEREVYAFDVRSGRRLAAFPVDSVGVWIQFMLAPDGTTLAYSTLEPIRDKPFSAIDPPWTRLKLADLETGRTCLAIQANVACGFSHDGRFFAAAHCMDSPLSKERDRIEVWETATGSWVRTLRGFEGTAVTAVFSPDASLLATDCCDLSAPNNTPRDVYIFQVTTGALLAELTCCSVVGFTADGRILVTQSVPSKRGGALLRLWDTHSWTELRPIAATQDAGASGWAISSNKWGSPRLVVWESYQRPSPTPKNWGAELMGGGRPPNPERLLVRVIDPRTAAEEHRFDIPAGYTVDHQVSGRESRFYITPSMLLACCVSEDGRTLAVRQTEPAEIHLFRIPPRPIGLYLLFSALPALVFTGVLWWRVG